MVVFSEFLYQPIAIVSRQMTVQRCKYRTRVL